MNKELQIQWVHPIAYALAESSGEAIDLYEMPWSKLEHTREQFNKAGETLISQDVMDHDYYEALDIVNNWRAAHACPLQTIKMALHRRALRADASAIVSQRTKRIPAISLKLRENHTAGMKMKLTQMQDIGGCRAVLRSVTQVEDLVAVYKKATAKNSTRGGLYHREYDYIETPKDTGYRSFHYVYRYHSDSNDLKEYNGLKVEIQLRSMLQHYWATAVETVDFITGQALKSNIGELPWKRFFILVSNEFARLEKRSLVPGAPSDVNSAKEELRNYSNQIKTLEAFRAATKLMTERAASVKDAQLFLLQLDLGKRMIRSIAFSKAQSLAAQAEYVKMEANSDPRNTQTVLVSVDSVASLPKAYPSFYLDISEFVKVLNRILEP